MVIETIWRLSPFWLKIQLLRLALIFLPSLHPLGFHPRRINSRLNLAKNSPVERRGAKTPPPNSGVLETSTQAAAAVIGVLSGSLASTASLIHPGLTTTDNPSYVK